MKKLLLVFLLTGCGSLHESYVKQDRSNFETLAPKVNILLDNSSILPPDEEQDIRDRLNSWDARTTAAIKSLGEE